MGGVGEGADDLVILNPLSDEFDEKVQAAQEQLLHLRHQQEQLEKQKADLEELKRKRAKFLRGRVEATERLGKASHLLEREVDEAARRIEHFERVREVFDRHLETLTQISPEEWSREQLRDELCGALGLIEAAHDDYTTEMSTVMAMLGSADGAAGECLAPPPVEVVAEVPGAGAGGGAEGGPGHGGEGEREFLDWLKAGFAFTLPMLVFGLVVLVLALVLL